MAGGGCVAQACKLGPASQLPYPIVPLPTQPEGKNNAAYSPRHRIQLNHYQQASVEEAVQKRLRDWTFAQYNHTPGSFNLLKLLAGINNKPPQTVVIPNSRALALSKARSQRVKHLLRW